MNFRIAGRKQPVRENRMESLMTHFSERLSVWSLILIRYSSAFSSLASALAVLRFWVATGGSEPSRSCFWSTGVTLAGAGAETVCCGGLGWAVATEAVPGSQRIFFCDLTREPLQYLIRSHLRFHL